jgi:hypothetical protein
MASGGAPPAAILSPTQQTRPLPNAFQQRRLPLITTCAAPSQLKSPPETTLYLTGALADPQGAYPSESLPSIAPLGMFSAAKTSGQAQQWTVAQNCVTYDQAMSVLVPQAIRYAAWFIDFMFRGSISATLTSNGALSITNNSQSEPLTSGVFQLYADDADGNRSLVGSSCSVAAIQPNITDGSCVLGPLPTPYPPSGNYLLVFQGTIGQEANQVAFTSVSAPTHWDANADFSLVSNPNGPWTYLVNATPFMYAAQNFGGTAGLEAWWDGLGVPDSVGVIKNETNGTLTQGGTRVLVPGLLVMDPESQLAVITFTAPVAGAFSIQGEFTGADNVGNSHAVYIELNGVGLWDSAIISYGGVAAFNLNQTLAVGDVISFNVETGTLGCAYCFLSTGFNATISPQGSSTSGP